MGKNKLSIKKRLLEKVWKKEPDKYSYYFHTKDKKILSACISNHNSTREKTIILLMISNKEKEGLHYLAVKKLSTLLRRTTSKHHEYFHCLNCFHSFRTWNKFKSHEKVCKNKDFCGTVMPRQKNKILKFNQHMKSDKMPYIIYSDLESLIWKNRWMR